MIFCSQQHLLLYEQQGRSALITQQPPVTGAQQSNNNLQQQSINDNNTVPIQNLTQSGTRSTSTSNFISVNQILAQVGAKDGKKHFDLVDKSNQPIKKSIPPSNKEENSAHVSSSPPYLTQLPCEIYPMITQHLSAKDLVSLEQTCTSLRDQISNIADIWHHKCLQRDYCKEQLSKMNPQLRASLLECWEPTPFNKQIEWKTQFGKQYKGERIIILKWRDDLLYYTVDVRDRCEEIKAKIARTLGIYYHHPFQLYLGVTKISEGNLPPVAREAMRNGEHFELK